MTSKNTLGMSGAGAPMTRTHYVEIPPQETLEASWRRREMSRAFGTAERLSTAPNTME